MNFGINKYMPRNQEYQEVKTVEYLRREVEKLREVLARDPQNVSIECLDRILDLQNKAQDLQNKISASNKIETSVICNATKTFCDKAIQEISKSGCLANKASCNKKRNKNKKCYVCKLFENFYELFK